MTSKTKSIPDHVPAERVVDIDNFALPGGDTDPQIAWTSYGKVTDHHLVFSPYSGGHWVVTEPAAIMRFMRDTANFSSRNASLPKHPGPRFIPLETDPPQHTHYRANVLPFFANRRIRAIEPDMRALAQRLIDDVIDNGECEFIGDLAIPYAVSVFLQIMGLPAEDGRYLNRLVNKLARSDTSEARGEAVQSMMQYLASHIEARKTQPGDDAITAITQASFDGRPYTDEEIQFTAALLVFGGVDSVAMLLGFVFGHLAQHAQDRRIVRDSLEELAPVVAEFARRYAVTTRMREVAHDVEYDGVVMRQGDMVLLPVASYNLDESLFPDAEKIDFTRPAGKPTLTFGTGAHTCPGAGLARLELQVFLQEWLTRVPEFGVKPGTSIRKRAATINSVDELRLSWANAS